MGTSRFGRLPDTKPWRIVVAHIASGADVATVAQTTSAAESLAALVGDRADGLFPSGADVQRAVADFSTLNGFAGLGHDYYARFVRRFLLYHLGRELSQHVGGCGRFADSAAYTAFVADL